MDPALVFGALLGAVMVGFLLFVRTKDLPKPAPASPFQHLEERKAAIYESLRDLQFEYRLDKLSDADYQASKLELQKELAQVMAETDRIRTELGLAGKTAPPARAAAAAPGTAVKRSVCSSCGAQFEKALRFCGECGKPMGGAA